MGKSLLRGFEHPEKIYSFTQNTQSFYTYFSSFCDCGRYYIHERLYNRFAKFGFQRQGPHIQFPFGTNMFEIQRFSHQIYFYSHSVKIYKIRSSSKNIKIPRQKSTKQKLFDKISKSILFSRLVMNIISSTLFVSLVWYVLYQTLSQNNQLKQVLSCLGLVEDL